MTLQTGCAAHTRFLFLHLEPYEAQILTYRELPVVIVLESSACGSANFQNKAKQNKQAEPQNRTSILCLVVLSFYLLFLTSLVTVTEMSFALPQTACLVLVKPQTFEKCFLS